MSKSNKKENTTKNQDKKSIQHNSKTKPPRPDVIRTNPPKKD